MEKLAKEVWGTPIKIGKVEIKNRIAFPPLSGNWANPDGTVNNKILRFYEEIARGGCGMIVVSGTSISPEGKVSDRSLCLYDEKHLCGLKKLSDIIKRNKCFASIQLSHVGGQGNPAFTGHELLSPSGIKCKALGFKSKKLTIRGIEEIRDKFIKSAILASKAGFQAVELHLAHGYLLHEFISQHTNKRKDKYGGNLKNRLRLILEIISGIHKIKNSLMIGARVSGEDYIEDGINENINREILPLLEKAGVGYFSVTAGIYETSKLKHEAMKRGEFFKYSKGIKRIVNKPVIGAGKILDLDSAERHLKNNDCDMVAIGRGLLSDPSMVKKVKNNRPFIGCLECDQCQYLRFGRKNLICPQNKITKSKSRKILILGGARFHGLFLVKHFCSLGDDVYVLNRGNYKPDYDLKINHLIADRNNEEDLKKVLGNIKFDAVIDNNGYNSTQLGIILKLIHGRCGHYIFTSSTAVYLKPFSDHKLKENDKKKVQNEFYSPKVKNYALGKFYAEDALHKNSFNLKYTILRLPDVFGENDFLGKLLFFYYRLKDGGKILLEKEVERFSLIYVKDLVRMFDKVVQNEACYGKAINIADTHAYTYDMFFSKIYGNLYSKSKLFLIPARKMEELKYFPLFPWGPEVDTSLSERLLGKINFTPLDRWGPKALKWELKNLKDKASDIEYKKTRERELELIKSIKRL